jgi:hypothetical protein
MGGEIVFTGSLVKKTYVLPPKGEAKSPGYARKAMAGYSLAEQDPNLVSAVGIVPIPEDNVNHRGLIFKT